MWLAVPVILFLSHVTSPLGDDFLQLYNIRSMSDSIHLPPRKMPVVQPAIDAAHLILGPGGQVVHEPSEDTQP